MTKKRIKKKTLFGRWFSRERGSNTYHALVAKATAIPSDEPLPLTKKNKLNKKLAFSSLYIN